MPIQNQNNSLIIKQLVNDIKKKFIVFFIDIANVVNYQNSVFKNIFTNTFEFNEFLKQCYQIGNKSVGLISITGIIIGLVLTIQSRPPLVDFGAIGMLPGMVAISIIREMGPVITALICAGKIGSSMGAELGSMRVTEQIDAMEVSNTNPINFLIVPRVLAATIMIPILTLYADVIGIFGSWLGVNIKDNVSITLFIHQAFNNVDFIDLVPALIKSFFFGAVIGLVGCYKGFHAGRGTESVGIAANSAVVTSSLLLIIVDLIAVQITDLL
ncbi:ABC transporter permease [Flavobacterium jejuense]|uniref:ABC transporter permease n=1 Tax=Flavobacterium jejuense TaxID=1544455 RepID=A0ABX0ISZ7_9FLAO|nr:ABC transporter permease [Flavobacterium jejuense]NHN26897.1 ABC transporter permease [Flavobacterium jejuense]